MVKKMEVIMLTICAATIFPFIIFLMWIGVLYIEGTCSSFSRDYTFKLNDIVESRINYHYDGLNENSKSNVNIISNGKLINIGVYEDFNDNSLDADKLFEKVLNNNNYDVYYFHSNEIYDVKDRKVREYIKPLIIFKDGTIKCYENSYYGDNEFISPLNLDKDDKLKNIRINIMKNEIENYNDKEMFLCSWKCLNELEDEKEWLNNKINNYYGGRELPNHANRFNNDSKDSKDIRNKIDDFREVLDRILYFRGDKIFYNKYYHEALSFNNITPKEVEKRYNKGYCKINENTYDFNDMIFKFNDTLNYDEKILEYAEIIRPIFYVNNIQIINEKYHIIKKLLEDELFTESRIKDNKDGSKEVISLNGWTISVDKNDIINKVIFHRK